MLTIEQVETATLSEILKDARSLPSFKRIRIENEPGYSSSSDKWYFNIEATHEDATVQINRFSERNEDVLVFTRRMYTQFLRVIAVGMPAAAYKAALTYDGDKTDVDSSQSY